MAHAEDKHMGSESGGGQLGQAQPSTASQADGISSESAGRSAVTDSDPKRPSRIGWRHKANRQRLGVRRDRATDADNTRPVPRAEPHS